MKVLEIQIMGSKPYKFQVLNSNYPTVIEETDRVVARFVIGTSSSCSASSASIPLSLFSNGDDGVSLAEDIIGGGESEKGKLKSVFQKF